MCLIEHEWNSSPKRGVFVVAIIIKNKIQVCVTLLYIHSFICRLNNVRCTFLMYSLSPVHIVSLCFTLCLLSWFASYEFFTQITAQQQYINFNHRLKHLPII